LPPWPFGFKTIWIYSGLLRSWDGGRYLLISFFCDSLGGLE